jgi:hypothetical protein
MLYFTDGGAVTLDLSGASGALRLKWINIQTGRWDGESVLQGGAPCGVEAPGQGGWVAVITK